MQKRILGCSATPDNASASNTVAQEKITEKVTMTNSLKIEAEKSTTPQ